MTPSQSTELMAAKLVDAERPIKPDRFIEQLVLEDVRLPGKYHFWKVIAVLLALAGLGALWTWGPLGEWITAETLASQGANLRDNPMAAFVVTFAYVAGGLVMMPLVLLVVATALIFEPPMSIAYAYMGCLASAMVCYVVGRRVGRDSIRKLAGTRLNKISRLLARQGVLTVATVRLVPVAPYTIVNLVMGAARVRLHSYIIGTVIGLAPGIVTISLFTDGIHGAISEPGPWNYFIVAVVAVVGILGSMWLKEWVSTRAGQDRNISRDTRRMVD